jgi:hypothetical protein
MHRGVIDVAMSWLGRHREGDDSRPRGSEEPAQPADRCLCNRTHRCPDRQPRSRGDMRESRNERFAAVWATCFLAAVAAHLLKAAMERGPASLAEPGATLSQNRCARQVVYICRTNPANPLAAPRYRRLRHLVDCSVSMSSDDEDKEGMDTSGELRRREQAEEAARERAKEQEREQLRILEAAREAERRRHDD